MCGRFIILDEGEIAEINKIVQEIGMKYDGRGLSMKLGEVYPTDNAAIVALQNEKPTLSLMQWGFPKWDSKGVIINAKSETANEKKMFASAFAGRRCVIPSNGFFEWAKSDGRSKEKFRFNSPDTPMLYMAGLYTNFSSRESDEPLTEKFVILTRSANSDVSDIHNRMPVMLHKNEISHWLKDAAYAKEIIHRDDFKLIREAV